MTAPDTATRRGWTADGSQFGARLALIRQHMGWGNVEKAAKECGIPVETWRSWERDNREPQRLTTIALAIATRTGCDYLWLVHGPNRGGTITSTAYVGARVVAIAGRSSDHHAAFGHATTRPVRQTRPIGGTAPLSPAPAAL